MKKRNLYVYTAVLSIIFTSLLSMTAIPLILSIKRQSKEASSTEPETVYVNIVNGESESVTDISIGWTIKEYNGKVGIFTADGSLLQTLETYVKTLPEADRTALREGIWVSSENELYSIIEAYAD